jgi:hypothetical protein
MTIVNTTLYASFVGLAEFKGAPAEPAAWRIAFSDAPGSAWSPPFGSERDAKIAVRALALAGYVDAKSCDELTDDEFLRICCEALMW